VNIGSYDGKRRQWDTMMLLGDGKKMTEKIGKAR
jgi:hypothetical protein